MLREKERKVQEDQKREQDKELEREKQRLARERSIDAETTSARRNKYSREALRAAAAAESKKEIVSSLDISRKHTISSKRKCCNQSESKN